MDENLIPEHCPNMAGMLHCVNCWALVPADELTDDLCEDCEEDLNWRYAKEELR